MHGPVQIKVKYKISITSEICSKDHKFQRQITFAKPLLEQINAMTVYEMNILQTLSFMYLWKNGNESAKKYAARSKNVLFKRSCKKNFTLGYCETYLWNKFIGLKL